MDSFVLKRVIDELGEILPGSLVSKIYQPGKRELSFELWKPGGGFRLLISAHPLFSSIHISEHDLENPKIPPRFCQALRKYIGGARIRKIELTEFERVFRIEFGTKGSSERDSSFFTLVAEMFGRHSNMILLDENNIIINALNIVTKDETGIREVISGIAYRPLPPLPKTFLPLITKEACRHIMMDSWDDIQSTIMRNVHGISKEVISQMPLHDNMMGDDLYFAFQELILTYREGNFGVGIRKDKKQKATLLPVLNQDMIAGEVKYFDSATKAADTFFHQAYSTEQIHTLKNRLLMTIRKRKKKEETKLRRVAGDISKLKSLKEYGKMGELLKQSLHTMKRGQRECITMDYGQIPPQEVIIELDPSLNPVGNMNRYFRLYKKGQRGLTVKQKMIPQIEEEIRYLDSMQYYVEEANEVEDLTYQEREMIEIGLMRKKKRSPDKKRGRKDKKEPFSRHVEKIIIKGFTVYIGRNNRGNDHIVKNIAVPGDIWLHARYHPGSHVLIKKSTQGEFPDEVVYLSSREAATRSTGAKAGKVEIYVADAKDVSKIPGQKPGMVRIRRYKTIMVETDNSSS